MHSIRRAAFLEFSQGLDGRGGDADAALTPQIIVIWEITFCIDSANITDRISIAV